MIHLGRFNTLSNYFSLFRALLAIPLWIVMNNHNYAQPHYVASVIAFVAAITDYLDGYYARKLNQITEWGKVLDPLADKICVAVILIQFFIHNRIDLLFLSIVVGKDVIIVMASLLLSGKVKKVIPSNMLGKVTMNFIALYMFLIALRLDDYSALFAGILYWFVIVICIISFGVYVVQGIKIQKNEVA
ncbi:MAG: CDP-diacylglycerol--glycerol-3-phosphate 3-phosphatidyltransferase [Ignavibacteriales bacterium]|nr:CDP-diacylglycerol--glycerol-3-phosphate 3-phosphatidyltransferase [Ignavibacteriales bacterium]